MLFEALKAAVSGLPAENGIRTRDRSVSYGALVERIERAAGLLLERGVAPGARVAVLVPASPEFFASAYALFAIGAVVVPLSAQSTAREFAWAVAACNITAIIAAPSTAAAAELIDPDNRMTRIMATADDLFAPHPPASLAAPAGNEDAAYLFSSGSTGRPKVVPHTHGELVATGRHTLRGISLTPADVSFNTLPAFHSFGFTHLLFEAAIAGASSYLWFDPLPMQLSRGRMLKAIEAQRATVMPGVPFLYDTLAQATEDVNISSLRVAASGGVPLRRPVFERFRDRFGVPLRQLYGSTETSHIAVNMNDDVEENWNSVGRAVPGVRVEIVPSSSSTDPAIGELLVHSEGCTRGYLDNEAANRASFIGGAFLTGDLGRVDDEGNIYITGRSKLILEAHGQKVDPLEIEDVLAAHPAVEEAVVVGVASPVSGEQRLKAVVVLRGDTTADAVIRYCRENLSAHKVPELIEFREAIPRSRAGKVLRGKLMED